MKKISRLPVAFLALLLFAGAQDLRAWGKTWMGAALELAIRQAAWKFGPFRIQPALNLRDAGYDSNVYYRQRGGAGRGLFGDSGPRVHDLSSHEKEARPFVLWFAAIRLLPEDQAGEDLELLPQRAGECRPEQVLHHRRRRGLGRPPALEHRGRYPSEAQGLERRSLDSLAGHEEDVVFRQIRPAGVRF